MRLDVIHPHVRSWNDTNLQQNPTMTLKQASEKVTDNKLTSIVGAISTLAATILAFVPGDVMKTCGDAISQTQNPVIIGAMFSVGTLLTLAGPSLLKKSS